MFVERELITRRLEKKAVKMKSVRRHNADEAIESEYLR